MYFLSNVCMPAPECMCVMTCSCQCILQTHYQLQNLICVHLGAPTWEREGVGARGVGGGGWDRERQRARERGRQRGRNRGREGEREGEREKERERERR